MTRPAKAVVWVADRPDGMHVATVVTHTTAAKTMTVWRSQPSSTLSGTVDTAAGHAIDSVGLPCVLSEPTAVDGPDIDDDGSRLVLVVEPRPVPVGLAEIAERLGVQAATAYKWRTRGALPPPDLTVAGADAWWWPTIEAWAHETGRLP